MLIRLNGIRKNVHRPRGPPQAGRRGRRNPARRIARGEDWGLYDRTGQRKYLNEDERRRFIDAAYVATPAVRTFCLTLIFTGCRLSEALELRPSNIDVASGLVSVRSLKKRGKLVVRLIPVPPALLDEVARVHSLDDLETSHNRLWPWGRTRAWQLVKAVMAEARIADLPASPKGLRHAFGVHAVLSGVPITIVQKWLGHEDVATTAIYTNVLGPEERAIAARMWDHSRF